MSTKKNKPAGDIRSKVNQVQAKAKDAAGKAGDLVKANALVAVVSSKTLAAGLKEIGAGYVADSRTAVATLREDFQAISKVKSPSELVRLQREQTARNFKALSAVANKNVGQLRELIAGKVAPMLKERVQANLELFRKAA